MEVEENILNEEMANDDLSVNEELNGGSKKSAEYLNDLFVKHIKVLCNKHNVSISDLEKSIDVSKGYFSRLKNTKSSISLDKLYYIADYLKIDLGEVINLELSLTPQQKDVLKFMQTVTYGVTHEMYKCEKVSTNEKQYIPASSFFKDKDSFYILKYRRIIRLDSTKYLEIVMFESSDVYWDLNLRVVNTEECHLICTSYNSPNRLKSQLKRLISAVKAQVRYESVDSYAINLINDFMNNQSNEN